MFPKTKEETDESKKVRETTMAKVMQMAKVRKDLKEKELLDEAEDDIVQ